MEDSAALPPAALASLALRLAAALASLSARFLRILAFWPSDMPANSSAFPELFLAFGLLPFPRSAARFAFSASLALSSASFLVITCAMNSHPNFDSLSREVCNAATKVSKAEADSLRVETEPPASVPLPPSARMLLPLNNASTPPRAEFPAIRAMVSSNSKLSADSEQFISNSIVLHAAAIASRAGPWYCGIVLACLTHPSTPSAL
mmetsp:Transcript_3116/g.5541  ORF Transcript_3116/g.5541 Transcript_3116/m.5541 type:complete len:206 (-) Transcript_3116:225-842(-)